jgi:uncharacterized membrane protein YdjX (TVP38/TMEM64 family)
MVAAGAGPGKRSMEPLCCLEFTRNQGSGKAVDASVGYNRPRGGIALSLRHDLFCCLPLAVRELLRTALVMSVVLLAPVLPFLLFGPQLETRVKQWMQTPQSTPVAAAAVVGLLSIDIFLPIPSSVVSTLGGWKLGIIGGMAASFAGLSAGAAIGFALARRWGRPFAARFSRPEELERTQRIAEQFGPTVLVLTRAVPVLAEASVLLMGIHNLSWRRFLPPVLLSNLGIAVAYSAFGRVAQQYGWLPLALCVAIALPMLFAAIAERWLPK